PFSIVMIGDGCDGAVRAASGCGVSTIITMENGSPAFGAGIDLRFRASVAHWLRSGREMRLETGGFTFTRFAGGDARALFDVRNHESVRTFMPSAEPLSYARHERWVAEHLRADAEPPMLLFIGRRDGRAAGFGLLKQQPGDAIEVGVMVVGDLQRGL